MAVGLANEGFGTKYRLDYADPLVGSSLGAVATWRRNSTNALPIGLTYFDLVLSLSAAKLYSIELKCLAGSHMDDGPHSNSTNSTAVTVDGETAVYV